MRNLQKLLKMGTKHSYFFLVALILLTSCGGARKTSIKPASASKTTRIIQQAQSFAGTRYKFGGTTRKGMDCSGLIYTAFQKENIVLPRISRDMATRGKQVKNKDIAKGDLLFFRTNKSHNRINHVGLVTQVINGDIYFIHATTSKGVITSNLKEKYWNQSYVMTRRVLP